jgi:hypothetical protein
MKTKTSIEKIYRVEHSTKRNRQKNKCFVGPYFRDSYRDVWDKPRRHAVDENTPNPYLDKVLKLHMISDKYFYGFKSLESLKSWFNEKELKLLKKINFTIREYEAKSKYVIHGDKQSVFIPKKKIKSRKVKF